MRERSKARREIWLVFWALSPEGKLATQPDNNEKLPNYRSTDK